MNKFKKKMGLTLAAVLTTTALSAAYVTTDSSAAPSEDVNVIKNDEPTSDRIEQLTDIAMHFYWHGGDIKKAEEEIFKGITLKGKFDVVENAFKEATTLDPLDNDLKISLASTQIIQKKVPEALETYKQVLNLEPDHYNANLLYGTYSRVNGDEKTYKESLAKLMQIDPAATKEYIQKFESTEEIMKTEFNTDVPDGLPQKDHAIVILGYALADDGTMKQTLIERLNAGLKIAERYPNSKIIVSGGVPKQGVTEAGAMSEWLISKGIAKERIILEDKSTDTVENGLFSTAKLEDAGLKDVTLVTSASHMRRALTVFNEASDLRDKLNGKETERDLTNMVYLDYPTIEEAHKVTKDEKMVVYRDLLRTSGIWQYPELQR
ncbi:YdcF family protein [Fictibacillus barbaricus]|uniref:YdcF family protein n=1 Tax=Fictibacillus barbaricus TaxID=182136 RepID=A0ABS2ZG56_9BACL|nr:YdcF family protein [Fictibacillus barbaricus]MBN3547177.1 YdcF family protein [Fictibacillus barbaricus]GGB46971.1 transporter [Fictibacillus barbaricus]